MIRQRRFSSLGRANRQRRESRREGGRRILESAGRSAEELATEVARQRRIGELEAAIAAAAVDIEKQTVIMEKRASERDELQRAYREAYQRSSVSTTSYSER